ncbi:hypothetical protein ACKU3Z_029900 [Pseudomonas aeruginosa]|nr:hypothetical protein [Pseudomonas aeruginosa]
MGLFDNFNFQAAIGLSVLVAFIWVLIPNPGELSSKLTKTLYRVAEAVCVAGFLGLAGLAVYQDPGLALYVLGFPLLLVGCALGFKVAYNLAGLLVVTLLGVLLYDAPIIALMIISFGAALIGLLLQRKRVSYSSLGLFVISATHTLIFNPSEMFITWILIILATYATFTLGYKNGKLC